MAPRRQILCVIVLMAAVFGAMPRADASGPWWEPVARPTPDSQINVSGEPFRGTDAHGDVRGFADVHNHLMSNEGFGGRLVCGQPFSDAGVADALKDCPEHYPNGNLALFENLTADPDWTHDPVGWPTFKDWPNYVTTTHQQNYYAWLERSWRAGQRVLVTDMVTNGVLCSLPIQPKDRSCDEMTSIRLQVEKTYDMQDYIDTMYGGPGKGWFRIVTDNADARQVIEDGKLAVILGVETSEPFGCKQILDIPQCSQADIDRGLDELYGLGIRSMFLCHKFDNALCGVRFDSGTTGTIVNVGQFLSTGTFWTTEACEGPQHDNSISGVPVPQYEALLPPGVAVPSYDEAGQCNKRGLTRLGEYAFRGMIERNMMLEVDHMSVKAAGRAFDIAESLDYPGVISSHSWMDLGWADRLYRLGGFIGEYGHSSEGFVGEAARTAELRAKYGVGLGIGTDFNGVGSHPAPRGADAPAKVTYPFRSFDGGSVVDRQVSGERTWDVNTDGGAHVGLIPDWLEDVRHLGGDALLGEVFHSAQSYLDTWARTQGYQQPTNLATGARATASSSEWSLFNSFVPDKAIDGSTGTRWASNWSDNQWLTIDLRSIRPVGRVTLDWETAYASEYRIEISTDGSSWTTVWSTDDGRGGIETAKFAPVQGRYVRVHGVQRATSYGYSLYETGVFGS